MKEFKKEEDRFWRSFVIGLCLSVLAILFKTGGNSLLYTASTFLSLFGAFIAACSCIHYYFIIPLGEEE